MSQSTKESAVKRDLRTPKYRMRVVEDKSKEIEPEIEVDDVPELCEHDFLRNCPHCKKEN